MRKPLSNPLKSHDGEIMADIGEENYPVGQQKFGTVFVLDISGSMSNQIEALCESFNNFVEAAREKRAVSANADLAVIAFDHNVNVVVPWTNIGAMEPLNLAVGGSTNIRDAMKKASDMARERSHHYDNNHIRAKKPWIILMTDGYSDNDKPVDSVAKEMKALEESGRYHILALGMGEQYNDFELKKFTDMAMAIPDWNFERFFEFWGKSMAVLSTPTDNEKVNLPPENAMKMLEDQMDHEKKLEEKFKMFTVST